MGAFWLCAEADAVDSKVKMAALQNTLRFQCISIGLLSSTQPGFPFYLSAASQYTPSSNLAGMDRCMQARD
jgi:hypothetical protein